MMRTPALRQTRDASCHITVLWRLLMVLLFLPALAQADDVTPVHCVDLNVERDDGFITIRIGYINVSNETVTIPIGPNNFFSPSPNIRGQVTEFLPGVHERAFTTFVAQEDPILTYHLMGSSRVLTLGVEDFCSGGVSDLLVTPSGVLFASTAEAGIYRSGDGGVSWQAANTGLEDLHVHTLEAHPSDPLVLFAGTDTGVYKSLDGGNTWQAYNSGFPGANTEP